MYHGKEIYLAIGKHFNKYGLNETEFLSSPETFSERYLTILFRDMLDHRKAIAQKFICFSDSGVDLNPLELNLREFLEQSSHLYSHPITQNVILNCETLELRIKQIQVIYRHEIQRELQDKHPKMYSQLDSILEKTESQLMDLSIQDFREKKTNFSVKI